MGDISRYNYHVDTHSRAILVFSICKLYRDDLGYQGRYLYCFGDLYTCVIASLTIPNPNRARKQKPHVRKQFFVFTDFFFLVFSIYKLGKGNLGYHRGYVLCIGVLYAHNHTTLITSSHNKVRTPKTSFSRNCFSMGYK